MNMELVQWENVNERWAEEFIYLRLPFFSIKKIYEKRNRTLFFFPPSLFRMIKKIQIKLNIWNNQRSFK